MKGENSYKTTKKQTHFLPLSQSPKFFGKSTMKLLSSFDVWLQSQVESLGGLHGAVNHNGGVSFALNRED